MTERELAPNGWRPEYPAPGDEGKLFLERRVKPPFCTWSVFERRCGFSDTHGPSRFGLLYLCAGGRAAFQALYLSNRQRPKAVAVIQPGDPVFEKSEGLFARNVLDNLSALPICCCTVGREDATAIFRRRGPAIGRRPVFSTGTVNASFANVASVISPRAVPSPTGRHVSSAAPA